MNISVRRDGLKTVDSKAYISNETIVEYTRFGAIFFSTIVLIFAISVIAGWYGHIPQLLVYLTGTISIVFNSALCFIMLSISIFCIIYKIQYIPIILPISTLVINLLTILEHVFNINIGIDEIFFQHYEALGNTAPGRISPIGCALFTISSIEIILLQSKKFLQPIIMFVSAATFTILFLTIIMISGYVLEIETFYFWKKKSPISLAALVGFVILGFSQTFLLFYIMSSEEIDIKRQFPVIVGTSIFAAVVFISEKLGEYALASNNSSQAPIYLLIGGSILAIISGWIMSLWLSNKTLLEESKLSIAIIMAILEATDNGIIVVNNEGLVLSYNSRFIQLWQISEQQMLNFTEKELNELEKNNSINEETPTQNTEELKIFPGAEYSNILYLKNDKIFIKTIRPHIMYGDVTGLVYSYNDITKQKELEEKLIHMANYDVLTDLPNKNLLDELAVRKIKEIKGAGAIFSLIEVNIQSIPEIASLFGGSNADILIKDISTFLKDATPDDYILARIAEQKFLILTKEQANVDPIILNINSLTKIFAHNFKVCGQNVKINGSIGAAIFPMDGLGIEELFTHVEAATKIAQQEKNNSFHFYSQEINEYTLKKLDIETALSNAVEKNEIAVFYQPIIDAKTQLPVSIEALARWTRDSGVSIPPQEFIAIAEEIGIISQLGEHIMRTACKQLKSWQEAGLTDLCISVNISSIQFKQNLLMGTIYNILQETELNPKNLEIEITEGVLLSNSEEVAATLHKLTNLGITIALDDFGVGYSSFTYVKNFPIRKIKIDKSFVDDAVTNEQGKKIISGMLTLFKNMNYIVVAEGVETKEQLEFLQSLNCDQIQGYYYAKPMAADDCLKYLQSRLIKQK